ncbi:MAG: hypothetical protein GY811_16815 [Myxococcales bacterium]|nr:hypothetical protein [Myxococcales bacterium]
MIKQIGFAALLSLSLTGACATDIGSHNQDLQRTDSDERAGERCTRVVGDFDGTTTPPPIDILVGNDVISAQVAIEGAQDVPNDPRAGLLAVAQVIGISAMLRI